MGNVQNHRKFDFEALLVHNNQLKDFSQNEEVIFGVDNHFDVGVCVFADCVGWEKRLELLGFVLVLLLE